MTITIWPGYMCSFFGHHYNIVDGDALVRYGWCGGSYEECRRYAESELRKLEASRRMEAAWRPSDREAS